MIAFFKESDGTVTLATDGFLDTVRFGYVFDLWEGDYLDE